MIGRNKIILNEGTMIQIVQGWLNANTMSNFNSGMAVKGVKQKKNDGPGESGGFEIMLESPIEQVYPGPAGDYTVPRMKAL